MRKLLLAATALTVLAPIAAHAQLQSGSIGGMPYVMLPASGGCSAASPCSIVTYLSYQDETSPATASDVQNYFGGSFAAANPHTVVIAPMLTGNQDSTYNWGGYDTLTNAQTAQMVGVVQGVEQSMGNTVNPADSLVTGGSLGANGTQSALIGYGPKGTVQPGVFSAGLSFDAATYAAASNAQDIAALCGVPLTAVHGTADTNQNVSYDTALGQAIDSNPTCGNSFNFVPIQGAGHGTWSGPDGYAAGTGAGTPLGWATAQLGSDPAPASATASSPSGTASLTATATAPTAIPVSATSSTSAAGAPAAGATATTPSGQITPGNGTATDCQGNTWAITASGSMTENGAYTPGGGGTSALSVNGCTILGEDNGGHGGGWFTLSADRQSWGSSAAPGDGTVASAPAATPAATSSCPAGSAGTAGGFYVAGGQIIAPNGQPFIARGVNVYDSQAAGAAGQMISMLSGINFVRVNIHSYDDPSSYQGMVTQFTTHGTVVEFEDHPDAGGGQDAPYTGGQLAGESAWYASMGKYYASNPYVWFGTFNEPMATSGLSQWQQATYQAIRGAGNNSPILLEVSGSRADNLQQALVPSIYASMTNTIWDVHVYGYQVNYSTDVGRISANITAMAHAAQTIPSADGTMPVLIGEYGPSTDGTTNDPNGAQNVTAVINAGSSGQEGSAAWGWNPGGSADHVTDGSNITSPYGQMVQLYINTDVVALSTCQVNQQAQQAIVAAATLPAASPANPTAVPDPTQDTSGVTAATASAQQASQATAATDAQISAATASITSANAGLAAAQGAIKAGNAGQ